MLHTTLRPLVALALTLVVAPCVLAQGKLWVVDDDGGPGVHFTTLKGAVTAATSGDTILLRDGLYGGASSTMKALTIIADTGADVRIGGLHVNNVPEWRQFVVRGVRSEHGPFDFGSNGITIAAGKGWVWVEGCELAGAKSEGSGPAGVAIEGKVRTTLVRCDIEAGRSLGSLWSVDGPPAMHARNAIALLHDCTLHGGDGSKGTSTSSGAGAGGSAMSIHGSSNIAAFGCHFAGGAGLFSHMDGNQCEPGASGGDGVYVDDGGTVALFAPTFAPGPGGAAGPCAAGPAGQAVNAVDGTVATTTGVLRSIELDSPVREFQPVIGTVEGAPGDWVWLGLWPTGMDPLVSPAWTGWLAIPWYSHIVALGQLPPSGVMAIAASASALPPGVEAANVHAQTIHVSADGLHVYVGAPSVVTVLDQAF